MKLSFFVSGPKASSSGVTVTSTPDTAQVTVAQYTESAGPTLVTVRGNSAANGTP